MFISVSHRIKPRLLQTTALVAFVACAGTAQAQTANTTGANVNVLNLLSPFLSLNATDIGRATLQGNLDQAVATNNSATLALQQLAISDKNLLGSASNTVTGAPGTYGVAANLAGGLPPQTPINGITPQQPVGGFGSVLGSIYVNGVANGTAGPLANTVRLLVGSYNFTSSDLGVAKNYFANGAPNNPSVTPANYVATPAVAPAGFTLPTANGLPNVTNSVYDLAYGVSNTQPGQDVYGSSRPVQVAPTRINQFDPTSLSGIATNPSFPSGHTNYAYTDSILLGMLVPELYQNMLVRASEYGNSRIVLGVHYPLDIIASRSFASYDIAQALTNPAYIGNATMTRTAIDMPSLFNSASTELRSYLATQCGGTIAVCVTSPANTINNPYMPSAANQALYQQRLTYGLPTLSFAQAPREAAPTGGPDASILLATLYGGSTTAARTIAPTGGLNGNLQSDTINQIIVNTQTNAFAAFYGTALSYWSRIDLYTAAGYFQNLTGKLTLASTDVVTTNVTVGNTGILAGAGTVGSTTVTSGGALQPGSAAPGTLRINGNLAFQSGALFVVLASAGTSSSVAVSGTASLGGNVQVQAPTATTRLGTYTVLTSGGGLGGTQFSGVTAPTGLAGTLAYTSNSVSLSLASSLGQVVGANGNQRAVGAALDAALNASSAPVGAVSAIFNGDVPGNLSQAAGQTATGAQQSTFGAMTQIVGLVSDPFAAGRDVMPVTLAYAEDDLLGYAARKRTPSDALAAIYTKAPPRVYDPRWNVWAAGFGGSQTTDGGAGAGSNTATSRIGGVAVGADYWFSPATVAGFALAGGGTNFSVNNNGTGNSDLFQAAGFIRHNEGPAYITAAAAYGWQNITTDRTVTIAGIDRLHAEFNANAYTGRVEAGYRFAPFMNGFGVTPYAAGQVTAFDLPSYAETVMAGAGTFALNYAAKTVTDSRSELGLRTDQAFGMADGILVLRGRAAWAHDFNPNRSVSATFQTLPGASFIVNGAAQARDAALVTTAAEMKWRNGWTIAATFEGEFSNVTRSYAGKGVVRYAW